MDILRVEKPGFIILPSEAAERLSLEALGLLARLSRPERTQIIGLPALARELSISEERLSALLQELSHAGYAKLEPLRGPSGRLAGRRWVVSPFGWANPETASAESPTEPPSTETRKIPVSVDVQSGSEEAGSGKVTDAGADLTETGKIRASVGVLIPTAPEKAAPGTKSKGNFKHRSQQKAYEQLGEAEAGGTAARAGGREKSQKTRVLNKRINSLNKNPLTVEEEWGQEVGEVGGTLGENRTTRRMTNDDSSSRATKTKRTYRDKPLSEWNAGDFVAYLVDRANETNKPLLVPKAAMGSHMRWLLEKATQHFGPELAPAAVKDLLDHYWNCPDVHGTGYILREAEWFWGRWQPPVSEEFRW